MVKFNLVGFSLKYIYDVVNFIDYPSFLVDDRFTNFFNMAVEVNDLLVDFQTNNGNRKILQIAEKTMNAAVDITKQIR